MVSVRSFFRSFTVALEFDLRVIVCSIEIDALFEKDERTKDEL